MWPMKALPLFPPSGNWVASRDAEPLTWGTPPWAAFFGGQPCPTKSLPCTFLKEGVPGPGEDKYGLPGPQRASQDLREA